MKAVAAVAHPDDCVIFAWPFIEAHPEFDWTIVYLTYTNYEPRGQEVSDYWRTHNISCVFLGFPDDWEYVKRGELGFNSEQAERELKNITAGYDLVLTHYEDGDYGHVHHKFVNSATRKNTVPKVYFASTFNYNTEYKVRQPVNCDRLPLHRSVIEQFQDRDTGRYIVTDQARELLTTIK